MQSNQQINYLGEEKIPKLMLKFSIPCISETSAPYSLPLKKNVTTSFIPYPLLTVNPFQIGIHKHVNITI